MQHDPTTPLPSSSTTPPTPATAMVMATPPSTVSTSALASATRATSEIKTQDSQQAVDLYQKGTELAHSATTVDDYVRAIELFSIAIAVRSDQPRFFFARGNAFRAINELESAANDYTLAISLDDRTAAYFANRGACYRKLNRLVQALEDLTAAVDMDSKKANHYFNRAQVLYDHAFYKEAIIDLTRALEDGSAGIRVEYKALQLRGNCYRKLGSIQKCIDDLERAIQLDGRNSTGFSSLAQAFLDAGDLDHAVEHFSNAIQFNNSQASYFALRGLCYYRKCKRGGTSPGVASEACGQNARMSLTDFNQSIKLDGKDPQAYFYRGSIRLALALDLLHDSTSTTRSSSTGGAKATETTASVDTSSSISATGSDGGTNSTTMLSASIAVSLSVEEQLEAAFADIEMAWTLSPKGVKFQVGMAMITQLKQQYAAASALFRDIHGSDLRVNANVVVKYHWALCCHTLGDVELSLTLLCDCVEAMPSEPLFVEARALVLQEAGHHELAIGDWTEAIAIRQDDQASRAGLDSEETHDTIAWDLYLRSESHLRLDQYADAIADTSQALASIQVGPGLPVLLQLLETSVRNTRAMAHRGSGQYDQALEDLTICLRLAPTNDVFLYHRALCFLECARFGDALPDFLAALASTRNDPNETPGDGDDGSTAATRGEDAFLLYCVGLCYYHEQQPHKCIAFMEQARRCIHTNSQSSSSSATLAVLPDLHYYMGVAHALEGDNIKAIEHFTFAVDHHDTTSTTGTARDNLEPSAVDAAVVRYIHERAKALQLERYFDESIEDFSFVIRYNPHNAHAYFRRGFAYKSLGNLAAAAADFESAKLLDPHNPRLVVKYKELKHTECIVLCAPGQEPAF